jgi:hypothetical protein
MYLPADSDHSPLEDDKIPVPGEIGDRKLSRWLKIGDSVEDGEQPSDIQKDPPDNRMSSRRTGNDMEQSGGEYISRSYQRVIGDPERGEKR